MLNEDLFQNGALAIENRKSDLYTAKLNVYAGYIYVTLDFEKLSGTVGLRYEFGKIDANWDIGNYVGSERNATKGNPDLKYSKNYNIDLKRKISPQKESLTFITKQSILTKFL